MRKMCVTALLVLALWATAGSASQSNQPYTVIASYYQHGTKTASGEKFDRNGLTAAHRQYPFGSRLKVTNLRNGMSVIVRVNDRGPFVKKVAIDLSRGAARAIKMTGTMRVSLELIE